MCKGSLVLKVTEETGDEVVSGAVYCPKCEQAYPITDAIPNLLPPELRENT